MSSDPNYPNYHVFCFDVCWLVPRCFPVGLFHCLRCTIKCDIHPERGSDILDECRHCAHTVESSGSPCLRGYSHPYIHTPHPYLREHWIRRLKSASQLTVINIRLALYFLLFSLSICCYYSIYKTQYI